MYLLYCDETNLDKREDTFFIYGAIGIHVEQCKSLHDKIEKVRSDFKIEQDFLLKFNPKPENLEHEEFIKVKQAVIDESINHNCILFTSLILHNIATTPEEARLREINRILFHFNIFLGQQNDFGLVLIDRFTDRQIDSHLREKFAIGIRGLPYTDPMRLGHIVGYHYSAIGQSHFGSIVDIIIGTFRHSVNIHAKKELDKIDSAKKLLRIISPLFIQNERSQKISEISLFFSPKIIKAEKYRTLYQELKDFLLESGISPEQIITGDRTY